LSWNGIVCKFARVGIGERKNIMAKWKEVTMTNPPYFGLRIVLLILSIVIAASGVLMIFGSKTLVVWAFMHPPEHEVTNLFMLMMKQMGGIFLMLSLMLYLIFRDPVKNIAIFDAFLVGLTILALTPLLSAHTLTLWPPYTAFGLWLKALLRLGFVALLFYLRPRLPASEVAHPAPKGRATGGPG